MIQSLSDRIHFRLAAYVLFGAGALVVVGALAALFALSGSRSERQGDEVTTEVSRELAGVTQGAVEPFETYSQALRTRQLFKSVEAPKPAAPAGPGIEQLAQHLAFTGVVQLDQLEAIINDRRTRQTFFVRAGSSIGELKVVEVTESRVVLSHGSERKELYLQ